MQTLATRSLLFGWMILLLSLAPMPQTQFISISPDLGALDTVVTITGSGFGAEKPRVWLSKPGAPKRYRLKVLTYGDKVITARVRTGVEGELELYVKPKGGAASLSPTTFELRAPEVTLVQQVLVSKGDSLDVHGNFLGQRRVSIRIGKRRAKTLFRDDVTGHHIVRVRGKTGCHPVTIRNPLGTGASTVGLAVLDAQGRLGPNALSYRSDGQQRRSTDVELQPSPLPLPAHLEPATRLVGRTRVSSACQKLFLDFALQSADPLPQSWSGVDRAALERRSSCCSSPKKNKNKSGGGCSAILWLDVLNPALPWRVDILAFDGQRIAGSFMGTVQGMSWAPSALTEGCFVVDVLP